MWARSSERADDGFTLIEVLVALVVLALGAAAVIPVLVLGAKTANFAKLNTQAKNLAQQRIERLRDLQFHVERQNGPFVDLLDQYYTDRSTSPSSRSVGGETATVQWIGTGTPGAGEPAVPFYRVRFAALDGYPQFSQVVDSQFLSLSGSPAAATAFPTYDSQVETTDAPPTMLLGVTVITSWSVSGVSHSYSTYTRITDSRVAPPQLTSRASSQLLRVTSASPAGAALSADVASSVADGSLSTGSTASGSTRAGLAQDSVNPDTLAANWLSVAPAGTGTGSTSMNQVVAGSSGCGWASFGRSDVQGGAASLTGGLPRVPLNSNTGGTISAGLVSTGNNTCGLFSFNNQSTSLDSRLLLPAGGSLVRIPDPSGNSRLVSSSSAVDATDTTNTPHSVTADATASNTSPAPVQIFPGLSFVGDGKGLVNVTLTSASLHCAGTVSATGAQTQAATGAYSITVDYWKAGSTAGSGLRVSTVYTMDGTDPLAALPPSGITVYQSGSTILRLSDYISSWSLRGVVSEGATNGVHALNGIFTATTTPVRDASDLPSSLGIQVGLLSCVADDAR